MEQLTYTKDEGTLVVSDIETFSKYYLFQKVSETTGQFLKVSSYENDKYRIGVIIADIPDGFTSRSKRYTIGQMNSKFITFLSDEEKKDSEMPFFEFNTKNEAESFLEQLAENQKFEFYY